VDKIKVVRFGRLIPKRLMGPLGIVKIKKHPYPRPRFSHIAIVIWINVFVLDRTPQPFDKDSISKPILSVHADGYRVLEKNAGEVAAGKQAPLIAVEYFRFSETLKCFV
jgi:hypothetical protein